MNVDMGGCFEKGIVSKQGFEASVRRILIVGSTLLVIVATVLPASIATAQSQYLEGVDLFYRNFSMVTTDAEERLSGDFLDTMMRLEAGELERHTVAGVYAPGADGFPEGEANGLYAGYHYGTVEKDSQPVGYDADTDSFSVGYERWRGNTLYSINLASTKAEADFTGIGFEEGSEDQKMLSAGIHVMGIYRDNWTWRGRVAGFMNEHDYEGMTGLTLGIPETAEYDSSGVNAGAMVGYLFRLGKAGGILLPEIGGEYLYTQRESFATETGSDAWDVSFRHFYDNHITGNASLRWTKVARLLNIDMVPSLAAGVRVLLTDDKIGEIQTIGDTSMVFTKDQDEVITTASASLLMHITGHLQATLSYDGAFGDDATHHLVSLRIRFPY